MLLKTMLVVAALAATPSDIQVGGWPDGTTIAWQCQKHAQGNIKFIVELPDGKKYAGEFSCGLEV